MSTVGLETLQRVREKTRNPSTLAFLEKREEQIKNDMKCCAFFIQRKKRLCTHRALSHLSDFCTDHQPESLEKAVQRDKLNRVNHDIKMRELMQVLPPIFIRQACEKVLYSLIKRIGDGDDDDEGDSDNASDSRLENKRKKRNKRVSAPSRMANPNSIHLTPRIQDLNTNWKEIFRDETLPLHIDVGCAKGKCIEKLSVRDHRACWNHLGLEIRQDLVKDKNVPGKSNIHFLACNFLASASELLDTLPLG